MDAGRAVWHALGPAALPSAYVLGGLAVYALRRLTGWRFHDPEVESRGSSVLLGPEVRLGFAWLMRPLEAVLRRADVPASALTTLSVALAGAAAVALGTGRFALGGWLAIAGGLCDFFDGRVARARGEAGPQGAALDAVLDRYSDALLLTGLAWYWHESWLLLAVLAALSGSLLVSYVRARSEAVGEPVRDGLMQRAERMACLGATTALTPLADLLTGESRVHWLAAAGVLLVAVAGHLTAAGRFVTLLRRLGSPAPSVRTGRLAAAGLATALDFALVVVLVDRLDQAPWLATAVACAVGAVVDVGLGRPWDGSHGAWRAEFAAG